MRQGTEFLCPSVPIHAGYPRELVYAVRQVCDELRFGEFGDSKIMVRT